MGSYSGFLVAFLAEDLAARSQHPYPASPWPDASRPRNSPGCPHGTTPSYHSQVERVPKPLGSLLHPQGSLSREMKGKGRPRPRGLTSPEPSAKPSRGTISQLCAIP